jgi:heme exporter protein D
MMPDLGAYAGPVLVAYGTSIVLLVGLTAWVVLRARAIARTLTAIERRHDNG